MITLQNLVRTPLARALGWTLFHSLWEGLLAAIVLFVALMVFRSARVRYAAACLAMSGLVAGFGFTLFLLWPEQAGGGAVRGSVMLPAPPGGAQWMPALAGRFGADDVLPWLSPIWIAGVVCFNLWSLTSWMKARRLRSRGVCVASPWWQERLVQLQKRIRLSMPVALLESCLAEVPVVIGWLRPVILMPVGLLAGMPVNQLEAILLHELAHIKRRDYLVNLIQMVVESLFFYHPAIWWVTGVVRTERENCCDDLAVAGSGDAREYAAALAALEQNRWAAHEAVLAANGGSLVKRVRRLLHPLNSREGVRTVMSPALSAGILALTAALALTAWQTQAPAPQRDAPRMAPWQKWLHEDVVYIIQDAEKSAFLNLTTDEERWGFVEQFWVRRDPTPGTVENEFKNEHYRRMGFANARFGSRNGVPGWKSDRGRIYITFGPPDEIDAHASGGVQSNGVAQTSPFEQWTYKHLEGIGDMVHMDFVDKNQTGEYPMTMDPNPSGGILKR